MTQSSAVLEAFMLKYDRIYDPVANANALEEKAAQKARREALARMFPPTKTGRP
jgi:hypothetical protein